ncbi:MAG: hypothetical protein E7388_02590 [Ruminococcaceae bacterium]|nr:hypothetical protein [Oscillospiraceae bacterium]
MYQYEYNYLEYILALWKISQKIKKRIEVLPKGRIDVHTIRGYKQLYLHTYENGKRIVKYLSPVRDAELIKQTEKGRKEKIQLKKQLKFCESVIKRNLPVAIEMIESFKPTGEAFPPFDSQKKERRDQLSILTDRGEMVRSKSEKFIADTLYKYNLDYRYEQKLDLDGMLFHPDFTIINPLNNNTYYWEHLGLDDPNYLVGWENKKRIYKENGIEIGNNLIITTEKDKNRFKEITEQNFTIKRYRNLIQ